MVSSISANAGVADPEVLAVAKRRQFSAAYKLSCVAYISYACRCEGSGYSISCPVGTPKGIVDV